jgi:hypothetical protein
LRISNFTLIEGWKIDSQMFAPDTESSVLHEVSNNLGKISKLEKCLAYQDYCRIMRRYWGMYSLTYVMYVRMFVRTCVCMYTGYFTNDNESGGVENATHNTFAK